MADPAADPLQALRLRFLARCREDLALVERALAEPELCAAPELRTAAHRLSGAGGTFGYPDVSVRAGAVDEALQGGGVAAAAELRALAKALRAILQ